MTANCPRCAGRALTPDVHDPEIHHCEQCGGTLLPAMKVPEEFHFAAAEHLELRAPMEHPEIKPLLCPSCTGVMNSVPLDESSAFLCAGCGCGWLDAIAPAGANDGAAVETPHSEANRLSRYLLYSVTLPERVLRSTVGATAGVAKEAAGFLIPQAFQSSKTYEVVVKNSLKFLTQDVGGVAPDPNEEVLGKDFLARKAVGNFVDLAGWATLAVSPVWMMAIVSDVAYGSKAYVKELAAELQKKGLIDETSTIHGVDDVLAAVKDASGEAASLVDTPPLSVDDLRASLNKTREAIGAMDVRRMLPEAELKRYWDEMREIAAREQVSLIGVSGALTMHAMNKAGTVTRGAFTGVQLAGGLFNQLVIGHYADAIKAVREKGFYQTVKESSGPYIEAVWNNFHVDRSTWTEELLSGRAVGTAWGLVKGWFSRGGPPAEPAAKPDAGQPPV